MHEALIGSSNVEVGSKIEASTNVEWSVIGYALFDHFHLWSVNFKLLPVWWTARLWKGVLGIQNPCAYPQWLNYLHVGRYLNKYLC